MCSPNSKTSVRLDKLKTKNFPQNINRSLLALGNCINALVDRSRRAFVPYPGSWGMSLFRLRRRLERTIAAEIYVYRDELIPGVCGGQLRSRHPLHLHFCIYWVRRHRVVPNLGVRSPRGEIDLL